MSEPDLKLLRVALDNGDVEELVDIADYYTQNWDLFRYLSTFLNVPDIVKLCSLNRKFRIKCKADKQLQDRIKIYTIVYNGDFSIDFVDRGNGPQLDTDYGKIFGYTDVFDKHGHTLYIELRGWAFSFDIMTIYFQYYPRLKSGLDTIDWNIYKRIIAFANSYSGGKLETEMSEDDSAYPIQINMYRDDLNMDITTFKDHVYMVLTDIITFLFKQGFDKDNNQPVPIDVNSCVKCNLVAKFKSLDTGQYFCSKKCAENI